MRYGLIADIHGNLHALRTALAQLERAEVERYIVAGDIVGYGPHPNECVELVAGLDADCVAGNHDLIALGRMSDRRCVTLARESLIWTRDMLSIDARGYLAALPTRLSAEGGVVVAHGSLDDPQQYTSSPRLATPQLVEVADARVLVLGHTHRAWAFACCAGSASPNRPIDLPAGEPLLLNPGSVGQSRELRPRARFGVLDLAAGRAWLHAVDYDVDGCRRALVAAGLSPWSCHMRPSLPRAALRAARRAATAHGVRLRP